MPYRKRTLRKLPPTARKVAHLIDAIGSVQRILKNLMPELERLERDALALRNHTCQASVEKGEENA